MATDPQILIGPRQAFSVEIAGFNDGIALLPSPPSTPKAHRFQGGLIRSDMLEIIGPVVRPEPLQGRRMRIWLNQLERWHFSRRGPPRIGDLYDRTGELPGGGLDAMIYIPKDAWLPATQCLGTTWRRLSLTGVNGDGRRMTIVDFAFSSANA
jgi:hypothetical protein